MPIESLSADDIQTWIDINREHNLITIVPYARSDSDRVIRYQFMAEKQGSSGNSQNQQGSVLQIVADTSTPLSRLVLNIDKSARYQFQLKVFSDNKLVAHSTKSILPGE